MKSVNHERKNEKESIPNKKPQIVFLAKNEQIASKSVYGIWKFSGALNYFKIET